MFLAHEGRASGEEPLYVEDVFSAFTYTGNGSTQSIVNGIDLAGKGGLAWLKNRGAAASHYLMDTARGTGVHLKSESTAAEATSGSIITAFNSDGYSLGNTTLTNNSGNTYVGWTFREAAKFFNVVTYTGNGTTQVVAHALGGTPGMVVIKRTDTTGIWLVWHRGTTNGYYLQLSGTGAESNSNASIMFGNNTTTVDPTSSSFTVGNYAGVNASGGTYVAYLFAHDTTSDGIIQCGSFTTDGSGNAPVNLGWEAQYLLRKTISTTGTWEIFDTARGWNLGNDAKSEAQSSGVEVTAFDYGRPTAAGFRAGGVVSQTYIYIAIRKGLMRPPTDAKKVFAINARTGTGAAATVSAGSITTGVDLAISKRRASGAINWQDRLRGSTSQLTSINTNAETTFTDEVTAFNMSNVSVGTSTNLGCVNTSAQTYINYFLKQARGFFDEVGYTGTGSAHTEAHNLGGVPEFMIVKSRSSASNFIVYYGVNTEALLLNSTGNKLTTSAYWNNTSPTSSMFTLGTDSEVNANGATFIAYLFASCPGVSKVGTYTGTGTTLQIDCGFTSGARFVLIKRIDDVGNWYLWDTTRGIVTGNDPYLLLNSTASEGTGNDYIDPYSAGFELSSTAPAAINASGGSFLYLTIA